MSPTIRRRVRRISQAGFLALALVAAPAVHGQDGTRALLNQVSPPPPSLATYDLSAGSVDGERALLGQFGADLVLTAPRIELAASDTVAQVIDGARALMGRPSRTETRPSVVAKNQ